MFPSERGPPTVTGLFVSKATKRPAAHKTDNMKTWVVERVDGEPRFHLKMRDFASYYGFVPRVCHPYRPETKGKIESTIRYVKSSFWPGIDFDSLAGLNQQAFLWYEEANRRMDRATPPLALRSLPVRDVGHFWDCFSGQPSPLDDLASCHLAVDQPEERHQCYGFAACAGTGELSNGVDDDA
jgi:hypothetical protein